MTQVNTLTPGGGAVNPVLSSVAIQAPLQFTVFPLKGDTPDAYGNAAPLCLAESAAARRQECISRAMANSLPAPPILPINGTVFIGVPGEPPPPER